MYEHFDIDEENTVFEWDDDKDAANFRKHGIRFRTAAKVFYDPNKLICTVREENVIRLISARIATAAEKERYENGETYDA